MMTVFASAVGPLLLATTLQRQGSYDAVFDALAVAVIILGLACWWVTLPERETLPAGLKAETAPAHR